MTPKSERTSSNNDGQQRHQPKRRGIIELVVFDLDMTLWDPEMYQLRGTPTLVDAAEYKLSDKQLEESRTIHEGKILVDGSLSGRGKSKSRDQIMRVFSGA